MAEHNDSITETIKKLINDNRTQRSNWKYLTDDEKIAEIKKSYDRLENKKKEQIDTDSAPELNDDKENKLDKTDQTNPRLKIGHKLGRDFTGLDPAVLKRMEEDCKDLSSSGINNDALREPVPIYNKSNAEVVYQGQNNSWIVLGRDRPGSLASGYGGKAHTQAGTIDMVCGRMGHKPREVDRKGRKLKVDNNYTTDSARIYISQKTDIDKNFNLASGTVGLAGAKSAIGIKADHVRVIAREGIKLITRTDLKNSQGAEIKSVSGIDLIAGNDDRGLQPLVKGDNTTKALERLAFHLEYLNGIVFGFLESQMQLNENLALHFHETPFGPTKWSDIVKFSADQTMVAQYNITVQDLKTHLVNLNNWKANYLTPVGDGYILSRFNNVN